MAGEGGLGFATNEWFRSEVDPRRERAERFRSGSALGWMCGDALFYRIRIDDFLKATEAEPSIALRIYLQPVVSGSYRLKVSRESFFSSAPSIVS